MAALLMSASESSRLHRHRHRRGQHSKLVLTALALTMVVVHSHLGAVKTFISASFGSNLLKVEALARSPRRGFLSMCLFGSAIRETEKSASAVEIPEEPGSLPFIVDETNLVASGTEAYLDRILRKLQDATGIKVRVICPPSGLQSDKEAFKKYARPINKNWGMDAYSIVIVAEDRIKKNTNTPLPLITIQPGWKLTQRFQYRLGQDYCLGTADKFGYPPTVNEIGSNAAIKGATENVIAVLFNLLDDPTTRYLQSISDEEVSKIFKRHGLEKI
eukprot:TRINITY_DN5337_c3_g1_i1.p1 TRINITY_DN5337_c3_g1~~TRINITY_DN5337_c3_g1_i1.p1  ORF type:complete len:284 (-),score=17.13 TRINITY_DN5337_c3_g1_i1:73-894(-)